MGLSRPPGGAPVSEPGSGPGRAPGRASGSPPSRPTAGARWATLLRWCAGRRTRQLLWVALAALLAAASLDSWRWWQASALNQAVAAAAAEASTPEATLATPPALRFAQAQALATQGQTEAALRRYAPLLSDAALGPAARFNSANLLLRQGQALQAGAQPGQALALIELAKEHYRSLLRQDPAHWPARYNLERAQRLVADPEPADEPPAAAPPPSERAATTMRGFSPGLP